MRCRNCGAAQPIGLSYVCPACFGPLEVDYDYAVVGATLTREAIAAARPGSGAMPSCCPSTSRRRAACRSARRRCWPPTASRRRSASTGCGSRTTPATRRSASRTGRSPSPPPGPSSSASRRSPAPRPATWPARPPPPRPPLGLPAYVFIPADLEPAKVDHALAYGATVVPIEGTYDDVNRLCLEVADETGWGFVNINLRPFYAEGSKTLAYEIAESLGWRSPDVVVAPVASGAMFTRVARGFEELVELGLDRATGRSASSAARPPAAPRSRPPGRPGPTSSSRSGRPTRSSARWPSAIRPTAATWSSWPTRPVARSRRSTTR